MIPLVKVGLPPQDVLMPHLEQVLYSGMIAEGEHVYTFEEKFKKTFELPNALSTSSGTAALHIALLLAGVGPQDQVISTSMTAEPTNTVISQCGAIPVFADVDPETGNLDPEAVRRQIGPRTRAILVVHYAGFPAPLDALRKIADEFGIALIEDAAHALGARYGDKAIGTIGDFGIYSLQAIKHMTTIDGGMLTIKDPGQIQAAKRLRWFGMDKGVARQLVDIKSPGFKYNMHNIAGAIGNVQLDYIQARIDAHIRNGQYFDQEVPKIPGLSVTRFDNAAEPSYWLYTVFSEDTDDVIARLADAGVAASKLHKPNHLHSAYNKPLVTLPGLDSYYRRFVHIPCGWWVGKEDRALIVNSLRKG